ncbi:putative baseplate assembly protein [Microseira sp. BLCC-F43]|jgi:predicted phage baseplate assembly protein|uniref:putative baseplate assembly protein n=1 Tax=Microseira sp. BLCC-F43 TaxID=3153602 RepID=UPI0035B81DE7
MSLSPDKSLRNLDDCGCCEGITQETPVGVYNLPGLDEIAYRVGTHAKFKESLLARLSDSKLPQLQGLRTREDDDFAIAFLDAWSTVADVLTFYQERIANESYLRTAKERVSILHLARLIGYELRPGVAANTYLVFTLEDAPTSPIQVTIDIGTKVQSLPGAGEQPQTFETIEKIEARPEWNAIKPRLTERQAIKGNANSLLLEGITTGLKPGDSLLIVPDGGGKPVFRQIASVTPQPQQNNTVIKLQPLIANSFTQTSIVYEQLFLDYSALTASFFGQTISGADFYAFGQRYRFQARDIFNNLKANQPPPPSVFTFRLRAAIFGHNAPKWDALPYTQRVGEFVRVPRTPTEDNPMDNEEKWQDGVYYNRKNLWAENTLNNYPGESSTSTNLYLDNVYSSIVKDSYVVLKQGSNWKVHQVDATTEISKSDFTLTAKVTRLTLKNNEDFANFQIRQTTVFAQSEELKLARLPIEQPVSGTEIQLNGWIETLFAGQMLIICGELDRSRGNQACEPVKISKVEQVIESEGYTQITLETKLNNDYVRDTVTIYGNVARATHGETKTEVLGSGNASQSYQHFTLRQSPLTYVTADTPSGAESTLQVRVNDILWHEVPTLYGRNSDERVYITRINDDGKTTIQFGDGKTGSRLPTGQENITATYRQGIGLAGMVKAGKLSLLMTRPLGVKGVNNSLDAMGAQNPESLSEARRNAPLTVLTLDRIVSLQDYEDFARAFSGIAKALATWTWTGQVRGVFLTVAGYNATPVPEKSPTYEKLLAAMQKAGDPYISLRVQSYLPAPFRIAAKVKVDPDYVTEKVLANVRSSLLSYFSFDARNLGQPVTKSEAIAQIQSIPGVVAVDLDKLYRVGEAAILNDRLIAASPQPGADGTITPAELLTLEPDLLDLGAIENFRF